MIKRSKILNITILSLLASCASGNFSNQIEKKELDLLAEESFMRYNTNRLLGIEGMRKDFISQALIACHQKKIVKGLGILEEKMNSNKSNPYYWNALGTCYTLSQQFTKAQFYYELASEAIKKNTNSANRAAEAMIANNMGLIFLNQNRPNEAFDSFKKASSIIPDFFTPEFNMAQIYLEFNQNNKALDILKKLEQKNGNDIDLLYCLSLVFFRLNDYEKSFNYISRIHSDYLNRPNIVGLYAYNLMKKNRLMEAKNILEKRLYASEYNERNENILEEINSKIKDNKDIKNVTAKK